MPDDPPVQQTNFNYKEDPEFLPWLKQQPEFKDLFAEPTDPKATPASTAAAPTAPTISGGGQSVAANQAQDKMGEIVKGLAAGMAEGAVRAAGAGNPNAPLPVSQAVKKVHAFWGYDVD